MKTAGWAGLFIASYLAGHFIANPWLYPVGKILLFIKIYISALVAFIFLNQIIPYVWRNLSKWEMDFQQSASMKEQQLSGGMRLSFAAAGLSSALEKGKEDARSHPEPMPRNLSDSGDGAATTALAKLTATVAGAAVDKKEGSRQEQDSPRKLFLLPSIKAESEKFSEQIFDDTAECPGDSAVICDEGIEDIASKDDTVAVEEVTAAIVIEDSAETELIEASEIVPATVEDILADTQETSAEQVEGIEKSFIAGEASACEAETGTDDIIAMVEVSEELRIEEEVLEFEEIEPLVAESDVSVEFVLSERVISRAFRRLESETLEQILAVDATGIAAETMDRAEEVLMDDVIDFEAEYEDFAVEGADLSSFCEKSLQGGRANGNVAQVIAAYEESAENIEIAETIKVGANTMAAEESVDSSSTEQDSIVNGSMDQQYQKLESSREQTGEDLAMDSSPESEFECISMEETDEDSGLDICETVELAQTEAMADITTDAGSFESVEWDDAITIEAATPEEPPETEIADDVVELRPAGTTVSVQNTGKGEERFAPIPHSYSCRLRCQKPGGIFQGPVLGFYCRFICQHGNY